jgi:hypothetical protein
MPYDQIASRIRVSWCFSRAYRVVWVSNGRTPTSFCQAIPRKVKRIDVSVREATVLRRITGFIDFGMLLNLLERTF